ncbi:hypothetical protein QBC39DRAFT_22492 [Podospora conica]|nr:hypothetical protein QBC39DRAFT_22492 [Schizothecium conicum]
MTSLEVLERAAHFCLVATGFLAASIAPSPPTRPRHRARPLCPFDHLQSSLESASTDLKLMHFPSPAGQGSMSMLADRSIAIATASMVKHPNTAAQPAIVVASFPPSAVQDMCLQSSHHRVRSPQPPSLPRFHPHIGARTVRTLRQCARWPPSSPSRSPQGPVPVGPRRSSRPVHSPRLASPGRWVFACCRPWCGAAWRHVGRSCAGGSRGVCINYRRRRLD